MSPAHPIVPKWKVDLSLIAPECPWHGCQFGAFRRPARDFRVED